MLHNDSVYKTVETYKNLGASGVGRLRNAVARLLVSMHMSSKYKNTYTEFEKIYM